MAAIDVVKEEVADNLEEIADATRRINTNSVGFFVGGMAVGFAIGFYWGYKFNKEKIKAEAFAQSEKEVAKIREVYQQKTVAAMPKPDLEEIVEEQGYDKPSKPSVEELYQGKERPLKAPVPGVIEPGLVKAPPVVIYDGGKDKNQNWDFATELQGRLEGEPYVIHQDEFMGNETGYSQGLYTYYAGDDVLVDEENKHPLPHADMIVGEDNLKFGHGSDDIDVVFVRNDARELEMQIVRVPHRFDEMVLGLDSSEDDSDDSDSD